MFPFHFKNFVGNLDIEYPNYDGIPKDSPVFIYYKENSDLSKHEIWRRFYRILQENNISYLRPAKNLTGEWIFNLKEFRHTFDCLKDVEYLQGSITIEPEYFRKINDNETDDEDLTEETSIKISVYKEDLTLLKNNQPTISD